MFFKLSLENKIFDWEKWGTYLVIDIDRVGLISWENRKNRKF